MSPLRLTDLTIRGNCEKYGHPDGRNEMSTRITIPIQFIEGKNNLWLLLFYPLIFGFSFPALVGRLWFGNQKKTKDGVNAKTVASLLFSVKEEWNIDELIGILGRGIANELQLSSGFESGLKELFGKGWGEVGNSCGRCRCQEKQGCDESLILVSDHLLRIPVANHALRDGALTTKLERLSVHLELI